MKKIIGLLLLSTLLISCNTTSIDTEENISSNNDTKNNLETNIDTTMTDNYQTRELQNGDIVAVMSTSMGDIEIRLFTDKTPITANNFMGLSAQGYYDGLIFHRIIENFMIQGGDPLGNGTGGESIYGDSFEDEFGEGLTHLKGALSMANSGTNTNGSQFFIVQADEGTTYLDGKHSIFGQVVNGLDIVDSIAKIEKDDSDKPVEDVTINSVKIKKYQDGNLEDYDVNVENIKKEYKNWNTEKEQELEAKKEADKNRVVKSGDMIQIRYTGKLENGEIFDSNIDNGKPSLDFTVGGGDMIQGFDSGVVGMKMGETKTLTLKPEEAYGEYDDAKTQTVKREELKAFEDAGIELVEGADLPTQAGVFKIKKVDGDDITIDLNHFLAGKTLIFEVTLEGFGN